MFIDSLEPRRLMAAASDPIGTFDPTPAPAIRVSATGTLLVTGSARPETVTVRYRPSGRVVVDFTRQLESGTWINYSQSFKRSQIRRLSVDTAGGDDVVQVNVADFSGASRIYGGTGDDRLVTRGSRTEVNGGAGDDTLVSDQMPQLTEIIPMAASAPNRSERVIDASYNRLIGGRGDDLFRTFGGEDTLVGGSGDDRYEPVAAGVAQTALAAGESLEGLRAVSDVSIVASRVGLTGVEPIERNFAGGIVYTAYDSLRPESFAPPIAMP